MTGTIETLIKKETNILAELNSYNRAWQRAADVGDGRLCNRIDHYCAELEAELIALSGKMDRARESATIAFECSVDELMRLADLADWAADTGLGHVADTALQQLAAVESETENAFWGMIWAEHDLMWGNEFAPDTM
jgi:hypothetical protein